ncbi:10875_t:CDS:2 [Paraglomus occultum]|uniref:10875_t:CDS:1 n=1 Tax=Paraglomus occultum TaxID=144539 RepID=A0A9N9FQC9_9GLOM|nr:10875_t:CDS:2 [Paraglomus occultum]
MSSYIAIPPPTAQTILALSISYTYASVLFLSVEIYKRMSGIPVEISRKIVHVGAGTYAFVTLYLFDQWEYVCLLFTSFILVNAILLKIRLFKAIDPQQGATGGTVYFAFSCAFLIYWFSDGWEDGFPRGRAYIAIAGLMAMTYGDAFAAIIGRLYGHRKLSFIPDRTIEGIQANFLFTFFSIFLVWNIMSPPGLDIWNIIAGAGVGAVVSAILETISLWGTDNLTVPIGVSFCLDLLGF